MASMNPNLTLYLGDVYEKGTPTEFDNWYGLEPAGGTRSTAGSATSRCPTVGNHEYTAGQAPGYFDYWDNTPHYYSVNRHGWHIISLDANSAFNQTAAGTPQYTVAAERPEQQHAAVHAGLLPPARGSTSATRARAPTWTPCGP